MKSTPILMSAPMVRATLNGTKRQTRRIVKSPARTMQSEGMEVIKHRAPGDSWYKDYVWSMRGKTGVWGDYSHGDFLALCPYGKPGDELWIKETWYDDLIRPAKSIITIDEHIFYRADGNVGVNKWRPSIFMPRALSRITLRITDVCVERLQGISEEDAIAEGIERSNFAPDLYRDYFSGDQIALRPAASYASLWRSINGPDSWALNPWVWVVEFERIEK